jgi:squalene-hopene/tetraprenyl-beta-curcumene cyclase
MPGTCDKLGLTFRGFSHLIPAPASPQNLNPGRTLISGARCIARGSALLRKVYRQKFKMFSLNGIRIKNSRLARLLYKTNPEQRGIRRSAQAGLIAKAEDRVYTFPPGLRPFSPPTLICNLGPGEAPAKTMNILCRLSQPLGGTMRILAITATIASLLGAAQPVITRNTSLRNEVERAITRGAEALVKIQNPDGYWSTPDQPAVTALALVALQGHPQTAIEKEAIKKGYAFLEKCFKPDGSIHNGKGQVNYNTSVSLMALVLSGDSKYTEQIRKTRNFLVGTQVDLGEKGKIDSPFDGGVGYGTNSDHSDLNNTLHALEAVYYADRYLKDKGPAPQKSLDWEAAIHFIQSCQNLPKSNKEPWASDDPQNKGGFVYYPGKSMAGETNLPSGRVALRSYGTISYVGLLSYVYADLKKDDPRVQAVVEWLKKNFTLQENPGMGSAGLYYYYQMMAKALSAYGVEQLQVGSEKIEWPEKLSLQLLNLQKPDGAWLNENGRWWEKEIPLVTSYSLLALEFAAKKL